MAPPTPVSQRARTAMPAPQDAGLVTTGATRAAVGRPVDPSKYASGRVVAGGVLDEALIDVGRLLDITRNLDALRELGDRGMFEGLGSTTPGPSMKFSDSPLAQRLGMGLGDRLNADAPTPTNVDRQRAELADLVATMDWEDLLDGEYGHAGRSGAARRPSAGRSPLGLGAGLVSQGGSEPGPPLTHVLYEKLIELNRASGRTADAAASLIRENSGALAAAPAPGGAPNGIAVAAAVVLSARLTQAATYIILEALDNFHGWTPGPDEVDVATERLARELTSRLRSPGASWPPNLSHGGAARTRPPPGSDETPGSAQGQAGPSVLDPGRWFLLGVDPRGTTPVLRRGGGRSWIQRFTGPGEPEEP